MIEKDNKSVVREKDMAKKKAKKAKVKQNGVKSNTVKKEAVRQAEVKNDSMFQKRMERHHDELRWLYMELYGNDSMFMELCEQMGSFYVNRSQSL